MRAVEWNKKEELVAEQALRHLKVAHVKMCSCCIKVLFACMQQKATVTLNINKLLST